MVKPLCAHDWTDVTASPATTVKFCHKCDTYRFDPPVPLPKVPKGDLYYLEETREDEG